MKSIIYQTIMFILSMTTGFLNIAFSQGNCTINLEASLEHCTCINNGKITFNLTNSADCDLDTNNIRYALFSPSNSINIVNSISPIFNNLPPGEYMGTVSALHHTGGSGTEAIILVHDTIYLTLNTTYVEPSAGVLDYDFTFAHPFGKVRSLPCVATGMVQMIINDGRKPYTVQVKKLEGGFYIPYKTSVFESEQHHGDDPAKMDYHDYYDIDSLSTGHYRLVFTDACGYTLPPYDVSIEEITAIESSPDLTTKACNDDGSNYNSIFINDFTISGAVNYFAQNADYYVLRQQDSLDIYWKYRWIDPAVNGHEADTSEWENLTFGRLEHQIAAAEKYCDLWGTEMTLQIKDVVCNSSKAYTITLQKPSSLFDAFEKTTSYPSLSYYYTDSCGRHKFTAEKRIYEYNFNPYGDFQKLFTTNEAGSRKISYYIKDIAADTMIYQGVVGTISSRELSYKHIFEFDSIYHGRSANFTVIDAKNCNIYSRNLTISSKISGKITNPSFQCYVRIDTANYCDYSTFTQVIDFTLGVSDLDTFQVISSPGELSSMSMVYKADLNRWVKLDSNENTSIDWVAMNWVIRGLHSSGTFRFRYVSGCTVQESSLSTSANNMGIGQYYVPEDPAYKIEPTCTGVRIIPIQGSYKQHGFNLYTNVPTIKNVNAIFKTYGNPSAPETVTGYYQLGDTINISVDGDIRIVMCDQYNYSKNELLCHFRDTIIHCGKAALQYHYFYSYCCQISDTVSTVRTRAKGGIPPYLYIISDKYGMVLDSNYTGNFFNVPLPHHDTVMLRVIDQCGTNFIYKGQIIEQQQIKKAWFTDGSDHYTQHDSSFCQLYAITLDDIDYHWHGPGGFASEEQNPIFFIPVDSNMSGKYYLSIKDSVCGLLRDSLTLKVLTKTYIPELLWINDSICSGMTYNKHGFNIPSAPIDTLRILYDTLVSVMDDSTFLKLTILPVFKPTHIDSIVTSLDTYPYGGLMLSDTGLHEIKFKSACDCDSIVYVHLMFSKYLPCPDAVDYDGNTYPTVRINKYCWMAENLKSVHYSDGRPVAKVYEYVADTYPDKDANVSIFGRLYDWYAAIDTGAHLPPDSNGNLHGLCPEGWLLPTEEDFMDLKCYTIPQLRSTHYWIPTPGTNESGFNSLPAGYYDAAWQRYSNLLGNAYYWSSTQPEMPVKFILVYMDCLAVQNQCSLCNAYSVRCISKTE